MKVANNPSCNGWQSYRRWQTLVASVGRAYQEILIRKDLRYNWVQYKIDIERAIEHALKEMPDSAALFEAWIRFVKNQDVIDVPCARAIVALGPVFKSRGLHPGEFFRTIRRGGLDKQPQKARSGLEADYGLAC